MKRKSEFLPCSKLIQTKNNYSQAKPSISRNIPSEIWLKRNILKKLTIQLRFNKSSTNQYRKFRQILTDPQPNSQNQIKSLPNTAIKQNQSQIFTPSKQTTMCKLSTAKADNAAKFTDNFFALNAFSKNGMKSYRHKSSMCQGNNFINVRKAIILEKKNSDKNSNSKSYHKRSQSQNQIQNQELIEQKQTILHKRSFSGHRINKSEDLDKKTDFLKVTTKQLHFSNIDAFLMDCTRQNGQIFSRRSKTEAKAVQIIQVPTPKQKLIGTKPKISCTTRPKSCVLKTNKSFEFSNCQGWVTVAGKIQRQEDEPFFNILQC